MSDPEEELRERERSKAIDIHRQTGAVITHSYLDRKQELVAVNKNDLEDILGFDGIAAFFSSVGMFFLAGPTWLLVDKITDMPKLEMTTAVGICSLSMVLGLVFLGTGIFFHLKKRGRVQRIFEETKPLPGRP